MRRQPVMVASALVIVVAILVAVLAPVVPLPDPNAVDIASIHQAPSKAHIFGTDRNGRDQLARIIYGGRISLIVAFFGVLAGTGIGAVWGLLSGYAGGYTDLVNQRFVEMVLAIPGLLMAFVLVAVLGPGLVTVIIAIAVLNVGHTARVIRGVTLSAKEAEHVNAARAIGARWPRIVVWHVAPGVVAPFLVIFSAQVGVGILIEATLGFLGMGVPPPAPSWGSLVATPFINSMTPPWWLAVFPGMVISLVVLAFNLAGDGLRDELDPRLRGSR